jgi:hypothetical protein
MDLTHHERGATLIEAVVAASVLVTVATGTASLILLGHTLGVRADQAMAATTLAAARLHALRAIPWDYAIGGDAPEVAALAFAPADALDRNTPGFWQATDEAGRPVGMPRSGGAAFVVRWAVWPVTAGPPDARATEVCVFEWPGAERTPPLTCLASARARQP